MPEKNLNSVNLYLKEIGKFPLLSGEEEYNLAQAIINGDQAAKEKLILHNLRLVVSIAKPYQDQGISFLDLIQEGNKGLIHATTRFDPNKGNKFSTYATYWIKQFISRFIMNNNRNIRVPIHIIEQITKIKKYEKTFFQLVGRKPTIEEVAEHFQVEPNKIKKIYNWMNDTVSIDTPINEEDEATIGSFIEDTMVTNSFEDIERQEQREAIFKLLDTLTEREKKVIIYRFGLNDERPLTLKEIGIKLKVSGELVRRIEHTALVKLRNPHRTKFLRSNIM